MGAKKFALVRAKGLFSNWANWHLICHLQEDASVRGEYFYRVFEFYAICRVDAEAEAFKILRVLSRRLSKAKFKLIFLKEGRYCEVLYDARNGYLRTWAARKRFSDPQEFLKENNFREVFIRGDRSGFPEKVVK